MTRDKLITKIKELVHAHGREWETIATELNDLRISTLKGKPWTEQSARAFFTRAASKEPAFSEEPPTPSQEIRQALPDWLDKAALSDLRAVLNWWRERQEETMILSPSRPVFKGKRRNSGFHINSEILKRATEKLKKDKVRTGGSMSLLMELLLWEYIGRPQDLLESVPRGETDAWSVLHATPEEDYED